MRIFGRSGQMIIIIGALGASAGVAALAHEDRSAQDLAAIERLHQLSVKTTLADKADELAKLWDSGAVRIQPGRPAEIGRAEIYADDKREEARTGGGQAVCYHAEIKDLQITGDWAVEWGYFSYQNSQAARPRRGKVLRVIKRQPDGSWKFARVIGFPENVESAAPMSHPCE